MLGGWVGPLLKKVTSADHVGCYILGVCEAVMMNEG